MINYSTAVFIINDKVRALKATYEADANAKATTFKTFDETIKAGDFIIVPTDTRHKMTVCKVTEVDVDPDFNATADMLWVIGTVERADYEDILAKEGDAIRVVKAAELKKQRDDLRATMLGSHIDTIKTLSITHMSDAAPATDAPKV